MGIMSGAMTVRRFRVEGTVPDGFRDTYRDRLQEHAFREPPVPGGAEEIEGWVQVHNLLDADFQDFNRWLYDRFAVFALRVDKKSLPAKLFKATVEKRCEAWCAERQVERCPSTVRKEIADDLRDEWFRRTLPRVSLTECCWNIPDGWLLLHTLSETSADRFRKRFHRTFNLELVPWSPLDWLTASTADALTGSASPSLVPVSS